LISGEGHPTSEISSHLLAYTTNRGEAIVHCHMGSVSNELLNMNLLSSSLKDIQIVDEMKSGSIELATATMNAFRRNNTIFWAGHGIITMANDLEGCMKNIEGFKEKLGPIKISTP
jgi:ribulose-5-phosphate 4-epimerase/fuculose-1-phosphate aldolase